MLKIVETTLKEQGNNKADDFEIFLLDERIKGAIAYMKVEQDVCKELGKRSSLSFDFLERKLELYQEILEDVRRTLGINGIELEEEFTLRVRLMNAIELRSSEVLYLNNKKSLQGTTNIKVNGIKREVEYDHRVAYRRLPVHI